MRRQSIFKIIAIGCFCLLSIALFFSFIIFEKDSGQSAKAQTRDIADPVPPVHVIESGDTLDLIASVYGLSVYAIVASNGIVDERKLAGGDTIILPSRKPGTDTKVQARPTLAIDASGKNGGVPLQASFTVTGESRGDFNSFVWDFGNGIYSFDREPSYIYLKPGTYAARCAAFTKAGDEIDSDTITIEARAANLASGNLSHITVDTVNTVIDVSGRVFDASGNPVVFGGDAAIIQKPALLKTLGMNLFLAVEPGYSMVTLISDKVRYTFDLFVSPFPTQHSIEPEFDWYKTQFETGIWGNCGPACVAMVVHWATGENISVEENRKEIGMPYPKGALTYENMIDNFKLHKLTSYKKTANRFSDIKEVIDKGQVAIILFDTTFIRHVEGDKTRVFTDRYYPDTTGHYVVIKGYSLDEKYFVVYDPIPGDWKENLPRYTDGVSMIGRNRYFLADEILESIYAKDKEILVACRL